jgi:hypothetical protein
MLLKLEHLRKGMRNTWSVLKRGAEEGWRKSVGLIRQKTKMHYAESRRKLIS